MGRTAGGATSSDTEDRGAGLDGAVLGGAAGGATRSDTEDEELVIIVEDMGAGLVVIGEDEGAELIYEVEDETAVLDDTVEHVEQGDNSEAPPIPRHSQRREGTGTGARKRLAGDSSSISSASSRDSDSIRGEHERLDPKAITIKRKQRSWREGEVLERHRHHSLIGIRHPMIGDRQHDPEHEVYLEQGARDRAREAAGPRQDDERNNDQGANDPLTNQDDERGDEQDANTTPDEEQGDDERDDTATQDDERDDDQDAIDPRRDIQARLRRASNVIIVDTYANRPQRARPAMDRYQAGAKKAIKRLGRGRGPGEGAGACRWSYRH